MKPFLLLLLIWTAVSSKGSKPVFTQVTYLYDIHRELLTAYQRTFQQYLDNFDKLLKTDTNLIIFGGKDIKNFVWERRKEENTIFIEREIEEYQKRWYADIIQNLRQKFLAQSKVEWQRIYPSYTLKRYAVIMMAKLYLCEEALKLDKWNTDFMIWTDAGYAHIYKNKNVYQPENIVMNYYKYIQPQWSAFTYDFPQTIFFAYKLGQVRYINRQVVHQQNILAGNMGGYATIVKDIKNAFQNLLRITLEYGDFYSDEPIITMMPIRFPFIFPNTLILKLQKFGDTFYINEEINRIPKHQRSSKIAINIASNNTYNQKPLPEGLMNKLKSAKLAHLARKSLTIETVWKSLIFLSMLILFYACFICKSKTNRKISAPIVHKSF